MERWRNFKVKALGLTDLFTRAILAVKNNPSISFWEVYIAGKNPNPKAVHMLKFLLSFQEQLSEGAPLQACEKWTLDWQSKTELHTMWNQTSPLKMSTCSFDIILFVNHGKKKGKQEDTQVKYTGNRPETRQVSEDLKINLKYHQVISWKNTFSLCHYRFSRFKQCHLRGKALQDHFPTLLPGATLSSSAGGAVPYLTLGTKGLNFHPNDKLIPHRQGQHTSHVRWASLQVPEDNPCLMWPAEGTGFKGLCPTPLGSIQFKGKKSIKQLTPEGQCQNYHTLINPSSTTWKPLQI